MGFKQGVTETAAKRLNRLEKQLRKEAAARDVAAARYDELYREAFGVFDQELGKDAPARFVCEDGYVLGRQVRRSAPTVDVKKYLALVAQALPGLRGKRLLSRTVRYEPVVLQAKVAEEVVKGRLAAEAVGRCVSQRPDVVARYPLREASAKAKLNLEYGVLESPSDDEEWAS